METSNTPIADRVRANDEAVLPSWGRPTREDGLGIGGGTLNS